MGYHMAGFEILGIDWEPQPNYPFTFIQCDFRTVKVEWLREHFQAVHASPPCQAHAVTRNFQPGVEHLDFLEETRELLQEAGLPYVIENVVGAPLIDPIQLCGSSFGLRSRRHRLFESSFSVPAVPCDHIWQDTHRPYVSCGRNGDEGRVTGIVPVFGNEAVKLYVEGARVPKLLLKSAAMGIDWMSSEELSQAIPPLFTRHVGRALMEHLARTA